MTRGGGQGGVHAVQHAAMAGDQGAGILDAEAALDEAFEQIAGMGGDAEDKREHEAAAQTVPPSNQMIDSRRPAPPSRCRRCVPAQVLDGDKLGARRGPPIRLPKISAPVSVAQTIRNSPTMTSAAAMRQRRAAPPAPRRATPDRARPAACQTGLLTVALRQTIDATPCPAPRRPAAPARPGASPAKQSTAIATVTAVTRRFGAISARLPPTMRCHSQRRQDADQPPPRRRR